MAEGSELFPVFIRPLNQLGLAYMVTGAAASMAYGTPRLTLDIDLVLEISPDQAEMLPPVFPPDAFYCPPADVIAIEAARPARGHFNVIHMASGFKADFYLLGQDPLHRWGMARRRHVEMWGEPVELAPPEYVIVRKLQYFQEGGSLKHLRDIRDMFAVSDKHIDRPALESTIEELRLREAWRQVWEQQG